MEWMLAATLAICMPLETVRAEDVKFYPPKGWIVTTLPDGGANVEPPDVRRGKTCAFVVLPDVEDELDLHFDGLSRRMAFSGRLNVTRRASEARPGGYRMRRMSGVVTSLGLPPTHVYLFMIQSGPRVRTVLFASNENALFEKHLGAVEAMLNSASVSAYSSALERSTTRPTEKRRVADETPRRPS